MKLRPRNLPVGWYPQSPRETRYAIEQFKSNTRSKDTKGLSGVLPHAGWYYSGQLANDVFINLRREYNTICIIGGHLPPGKQILAAFDEGFETPLGAIENNLKLLDSVKKHFPVIEDNFADNTVEIQLPLVKYYFPDSKILWLRVSPSAISIELGQFLAELNKNHELALIGSTDLTHYGPNYSFHPKGQGPDALTWVKEQNDKNFIDHLLNLELTKALDHANENHSACSAGGAVCSAAFAKASGINQGRLIKYNTSYDIQPASSFVGYAAIIYEK